MCKETHPKVAIDTCVLHFRLSMFLCRINKDLICQSNNPFKFVKGLEAHLNGQHQLSHDAMGASIESMYSVERSSRNEGAP